MEGKGLFDHTNLVRVNYVWISNFWDNIFEGGHNKCRSIGVFMATEAKTWHLVFFLAVFVGYRNKTPDNIVILKCAVQVIDA